MLESIKLFFTGHQDFKNEDALSPSCLGLLKACYGFEEDVTLESVGIYPEAQSVVMVFIDPYNKKIEATFNGVVDVFATNKGQALNRNQKIMLEYEHQVDEFEVKGTCYYRDRDKSFHTHILRFIAEYVIMMFTFADVSCRQVQDIT